MARQAGTGAELQQVKAYVQEGFGAPFVRRRRDVPDPQPRPDEVVVRVGACALNRLDVLQRQGPAVVPNFRLPHVGGMDIAGEVVSAGPDASPELVGRSVVVDPVVTCGCCDMCERDLTAYCRDLRTIGSTRAGGFAEYVAVPAGNCIAYDASAIGEIEMASVPVASVTAWHALRAVGELQSGETVLVPGAGSGVGGAAIQIAKSLSCRVITTVGSAEKGERARATGADHVIDRSRGDWVEEARKLTDGWGVDVVLDHVGGRFTQQAIDACAVDGRVIACGSTDGMQATLSLTSIYHHGRRVLGSGGYRPAEMRATVAEYERGVQHAVVDSVWSFSDFPQAEERLESSEFFGKVVLCPPW